MHSSHPVVFHQLPEVIHQSELFWIHLQGDMMENVTLLSDTAPHARAEIGA